MAPKSLNQILFEVNEHWRDNGTPAETYGEAGPLFLMLKKMFGANANWQGDGTAKMPVRDRLSGNIGNNYDKGFANYVSSNGRQFLIPHARHWAFLQITDRLLAFTRTEAALRSNMTGLMDEMEQTVTAWMRSTSYLLWDDGRHLLAKGDGAYAVAGTTITFQNVDCRNKFEVDDIIRFVSVVAADAADPGTLPAPEVGTLTVTKVLENGLEVDQDVNVGIPTATNLDFISKDVYFDSVDPDDDIPLTGVFGFLAENDTQANKTFFGVDRSTNPTRLAGLRTNLTGSESPWTICSKMMTRVRTEGAKLDTIFIPTSQVESLMEELAARGLSYRQVELSVMQPQNLVIGVTATQVVYGGQSANIIDDRFLSDPTVSAEDDKRYVGLYTSDCGLYSADDAGWKDYDGDGSYLTKIGGNTQNYAAEYGIFGQYSHRNPHNAIVAKVGADQ